MGEWQDFEIRVVDGNVAVFLDGVPILRGNDETPLPPGHLFITANLESRGVGSAIIRVSDIQW